MSGHSTDTTKEGDEHGDASNTGEEHGEVQKLVTEEVKVVAVGSLKYQTSDNKKDTQNLKRVQTKSLLDFEQL